MSAKILLIISTIYGTLGVVLGAFGAHAMKNILSVERLEVWQTAVQYQMYHALALAVVGIMWLYLKPVDAFWLKLSGQAFIAGVLIFSGSLYLLCATNIKWLGAITPIGGVAFILGWMALMVSVIKYVKGV